MKYIHEGGTVDAVQWNGWCVEDVRNLCGDNARFSGEYEETLEDGSSRACWKYVIIDGMFSEMTAAMGDYIVRKGHRLFVVSPMAFWSFYHAA